MNNQKLVDAIGLLDDEMIVNARTPKVSRFPVAAKVIAAVLAIILVPTIVIFGGGYLFGNIGADTASPEFKYAFTDEALMKACEQSLFSICFTTDPPVYASIGANPPEIRFADSDRVIFTTDTGIFVYNYNTRELEKTYSLELIGIPDFAQGDVATHISVDESGDYALLTSSENMSSVDRALEYRILDFTKGTVKKIDRSQIPEDFKVFETKNNIYIPKSDSDPDFKYYSPNDFVGSQMASVEDRDFIVLVDTNEDFEAIIGYTELVIINSDGTFSTQRVFDDVLEKFAE